MKLMKIINMEEHNQLFKHNINELIKLTSYKMDRKLYLFI